MWSRAYTGKRDLYHNRITEDFKALGVKPSKLAMQARAGVTTSAVCAMAPQP